MKNWAWTKWENRECVPDHDKAREWYYNKATVSNGVPRWNTNNNVPPQDCCEHWAALGLPVDLDAAQAARAADLDAFLTAYRASPPRMDAEQMFEIRAAFGPGVEVVNVITGQKYRT